MSLNVRVQEGVALDGEAALRAIERNAPDLLLLDIMMPGIDGYMCVGGCARIPPPRRSRSCS